ncbi:MAG: histidine phosphatase family protein [Nocardioides sp.]
MGLVLMVRHGQASFGAEDYDVLSDVGVAQSRRLGAWLLQYGVEPDAVLHGAMRRQRDTATAMVEAAGWSLTPELDEGWNEFDHLGVISRSPELVAELTDRRAFQRAFVEATARWSGGEHDDEYDETWPTFVARGRDALDRATARDGVTVVVASGGPIAVACAALVDPDATAEELPRLWNSFNSVCANTGVSRVVTGSTGRRMLTFNEHSHLDRDLVTYR